MTEYLEIKQSHCLLSRVKVCFGSHGHSTVMKVLQSRLVGLCASQKYQLNTFLMDMHLCCVSSSAYKSYDISFFLPQEILFSAINVPQVLRVNVTITKI